MSTGRLHATVASPTYPHERSHFLWGAEWDQDLQPRTASRLIATVLNSPCDEFHSYGAPLLLENERKRYCVGYL